MNAKVAERGRGRSAEESIAALDLNDVAFFVEVVRAASFSATAKAHGVPVSTVSRRVARLERGLGARLLERTTRSLHLTDVGRRYHEHATRALDELVEGKQYVAALQSVPRGKVRITAPIGLGPTVASALAPWLAERPLVSVDLDLTERRVDLLAEGFDVAVRSGPLESGDFVARKLLETTRALFASRDYLARRGAPRRLDDLAKHDLIATRTAGTKATWELFEVDGKRREKPKRPRFSFEPRLFVNELYAAKAAAIAGVGIAMLPEGLVGSSELERVLPKVTGERGGLYVLYPAQRALTAAVRSCVDHLVDTLSNAK